MNKFAGWAVLTLAVFFVIGGCSEQNSGEGASQARHRAPGPIRGTRTGSAGCGAGPARGRPTSRNGSAVSRTRGCGTDSSTTAESRSATAS